MAGGTRPPRGALLCALAPAAGAVPLRRIYVAGSAGSEVAVPGMLTILETVDDIIQMSGNATPRVLFLGTAFYDMPSAEEAQTVGFRSRNCAVDSLHVAVSSPGAAALGAAFAAADVVVLGGGDMRWAYDRWVKLGIDKLIVAAVARGAVVAGGSSGAALLFDGGNSGALQTRKFKNPPGPLIKAQTPEVAAAFETHIRAPGFGVLPGVLCPHYNTQGGDRAAGFTELLQRHSGEAGIGLDHWAALKIEGDNYTVVSSKSQPGACQICGAYCCGSVGPGGGFAPGTGVPGAWTLSIDPENGNLTRTLIPAAGSVSSIVRRAKYVNLGSNILQVARGMNPDDGIPCTTCTAGATAQRGAKVPMPAPREALRRPGAFSEWPADYLAEFAAALAAERLSRREGAAQAV